MTWRSWRKAHELYYWHARRCARSAQDPIPPAPHTESMVPEHIVEEWEHRCFTIQLAAVDAVVSSTLTVESFINWYGQRAFDSRTFQAVDRLSLPDKWLVFPLMKVGKEYPRHLQGFQDLQWLNRTRNAIVHFKSTSDLASDPQPPFASPTDARKAVVAVERAITDLRSIDPEVRLDWLSTSRPRLCEFEPLVDQVESSE